MFPMATLRHVSSVRIPSVCLIGCGRPKPIVYWLNDARNYSSDLPRSALKPWHSRKEEILRSETKTATVQAEFVSWLGKLLSSLRGAFRLKDNAAESSDKDGLPPGELDEKEPTPPLCEEQREALKQVLSGRNVLLSGPAGTGKSLILKHIKYHLRGRSFALTASTGSASSLIGGQTVNSWARIGLADKGTEFYTTRLNGSMWRNIETLIIDEISMIHTDLFETLNKVAQVARGNSDPFGKENLIMTTYWKIE
ncbi:PIF1-like helicase-domain-containing protein [Geopyxis carbonaria]|nr:PIF1-like helicase-domain-containing protein [Geopyxis carbonaria]